MYTHDVPRFFINIILASYLVNPDVKNVFKFESILFLKITFFVYSFLLKKSCHSEFEI
jgi:hypothetical protein